MRHGQPDGVRFIEGACYMGDVTACKDGMGATYETDLPRALRLGEHGCTTLSSPAVCGVLAVLLSEGTPEQRQRSLDLSRAACAQRDGFACSNLGDLLR